MPQIEFARHLIKLAQNVDLTRPQKSRDHNGGHDSTAKLLATRETKVKTKP